MSGTRVWAELGQGGDGSYLDAAGAVWTPVWHDGTPACARVREGGQVRQRIELDRACFVCILGGEERTTLVTMVADWRGMAQMDALVRSRTGHVLIAPAPASGAGWP